MGIKEQEVREEIRRGKRRLRARDRLKRNPAKDDEKSTAYVVEKKRTKRQDFVKVYLYIRDWEGDTV